jgi:hypothetical protein
LAHARRILEVNYYLEPTAEEYIQKYRMFKNKKVSASSSILDKKRRGIE